MLVRSITRRLRCPGDLTLRQPPLRRTFERRRRFAPPQAVVPLLQSTPSMGFGPAGHVLRWRFRGFANDATAERELEPPNLAPFVEHRQLPAPFLRSPIRSGFATAAEVLCVRSFAGGPVQSRPTSSCRTRPTGGIQAVGFRPSRPGTTLRFRDRLVAPEVKPVATGDVPMGTDRDSSTRRTTERSWYKPPSRPSCPPGSRPAPLGFRPELWPDSKFPHAACVGAPNLFLSRCELPNCLHAAPSSTTA